MRPNPFETKDRKGSEEKYRKSHVKERRLYGSRDRQATRIYREVRSTLSDASLVSLYGSRVPIKNDTNSAKGEYRGGHVEVYNDRGDHDAE